MIFFGNKLYINVAVVENAPNSEKIEITEGALGLRDKKITLNKRNFK